MPHAYRENTPGSPPQGIDQSGASTPAEVRPLGGLARPDRDPTAPAATTSRNEKGAGRMAARP